MVSFASLNAIFNYYKQKNTHTHMNQSQRTWPSIIAAAAKRVAEKETVDDDMMIVLYGSAAALYPKKVNVRSSSSGGKISESNV